MRASALRGTFYRRDRNENLSTRVFSFCPAIRPGDNPYDLVINTPHAQSGTDDLAYGCRLAARLMPGIRGNHGTSRTTSWDRIGLRCVRLKLINDICTACTTYPRSLPASNVCSYRCYYILFACTHTRTHTYSNVRSKSAIEECCFGRSSSGSPRLTGFHDGIHNDIQDIRL